jgi:hypothetical protein
LHLFAFWFFIHFQIKNRTTFSQGNPVFSSPLAVAVLLLEAVKSFGFPVPDFSGFCVI